ncbi:hypothetical protein MU1_04940 [Paenibacillus glycanilyticus]|uniref:Uncharacterized protein n=2 Tax=Paenibacillus glycanilyticus TaxID=126569 RepID=A0ABQ6G6T6_9BACL|nr:hypothetical protein MU1_04940 [Paenibacillus glycanilyticus]
MNDFQRLSLLNRLSRIDLPQLKVLVQNNADQALLLQTFESLMLEKSESYRRFIEKVHSPNAPTLDQVRERFIRDEINKNPHYRFIYSMLQDSDQHIDCGCGSQKR